MTVSFQSGLGNNFHYGIKDLDYRSLISETNVTRYTIPTDGSFVGLLDSISRSRFFNHLNDAKLSIQNGNYVRANYDTIRINLAHKEVGFNALKGKRSLVFKNGSIFKKEDITEDQLIEGISARVLAARNSFDKTTHLNVIINLPIVFTQIISDKSKAIINNMKSNGIDIILNFTL